MINRHVARRLRLEWAVAVTLFVVAAACAFLQRGYLAAGGEFGLLLLPALAEGVIALREVE